MGALAADRNTKTRSGIREVLPLAADTVIFAGSAACIGADGYAVPAANTAGLKYRGLAVQQADNADGDAGDVSVEVERKDEALFGGTGFTIADLGKDVYFTDDQTVTLTPNNCYAGKIGGVESATEVWVKAPVTGPIVPQATITDVAAITYAAPSGGATQDAEARASLAQCAADVAAIRTKLNALLASDEAAGIRASA